MKLMNNNQSHTMAKEVKFMVSGFARILDNMVREASQYLQTDQQRSQHLEASSSHNFRS